MTQYHSGPHDTYDTSGTRVHADNDRFRARGPATLVELPGSVVAWSVTRYDVMRRLTGDPRVSRDPRRHWPAFAELPADWPLSPYIAIPGVLNTYGTDHRRLRDLMEPAFTPARIEALRAMVHGRVERLVKDLAAAFEAPDGGGGAGTVDLRNGYAYVISTETLCDLLGVPDTLRDWTRRAMDGVIDPSPDPLRAAADLGDMVACLGELIAEKTARPGADMVSDLLAARVVTGGDGPEEGRYDQLDGEEMVTALLLVIGAGAGPTTDLIANAARALLTDPEQIDLIRAGLVGWQDVVEETLRAEAPVQQMPLRYAIEDIDLGEGVLIRAGEPIMIGFGAAGRDPALHGETAGRFDIGRISKEHLAFGHGVHHCLGAPLARLQAAIALPALFDRFPRMELAVPAGEVAPLPTYLFDGTSALPVRVRPAAGHR